MKHFRNLVVALVIFFLSLAHGQESRWLVLWRTISLPNVQGGFNHMSVDAEHQRLFASAPTNKPLEIVDLRSGKPWRSVEGEKPAAARYAPEFNQLYVSRGQSLYIYGGETFALITSVPLHSNLDELQYDLRAQELYVGCMSADQTGIAIIGLPQGKLLAKISLPAKPQGIAVEQQGNRIFANLPTLKEIAVVDRKKRVLLETWSLAENEGNTPIGLDEVHHRLFAGARHPAQLVVIDTNSGRTVASVGINGDTDDLFYDPDHRRIYVSCGEGFVDVIQQHDADQYELLERIPTAAGARTSTFSRQLSGFYVGVPRRGDQAAELQVFEIKR